MTKRMALKYSDSSSAEWLD